MLVYVFPGQGSEKKGMAAELFDEIEEFSSVEAEIDAQLGYSLRELCLEDPEGKINQTQFTQPALFTANALHYYKRKLSGENADLLAGHSLGEYNALLAAGAFSLLDGIKLVQKRGALMAQAKDGGMAAVVGLSADNIQDILDSNQLCSIDLANFNSPKQTVVSGPVADIQKTKALCDEAGAKLCVILPASAAFHSRYMKAAADEYAEFLTGVEFNALQTPVIANVTAEVYPAFKDGSEIKELLVKQIHQSVRWTETIAGIKQKHPEVSFEELGPGKVLTKLIKQI